MSKKQITFLWGCQIALYVANIILTCIKGLTLETCILGWLIAILLAGLTIYLQFKLIDKQKTIDHINKEWLQAIRDWKDIIERKNKEIERLQKELFELQSKSKIEDKLKQANVEYGQ